MPLPARFWIKQFSFLGFIGLIAYLPANIVGELFGIVAKHHSPPQNEAALSMLGTIFGFSGLSLLLLGAIAIPGELSGLIRPYKRKDQHFLEGQFMSRKVLLMMVSLLAWIALLSLTMFAFALR